jgi:hypothetical protein
MAVSGTYTVTYSATDADGNTGTASRTVIVEDTKDPLITLTGANPHTVEIGTTYVDPGATADTGEIVAVNTSQLNMDVLGNYTVTYSATDADGNTGTASRTVTVLISWSEQQKIVASDKQYLDYLGYSVAISGDGNTAIAGAPYEDGAGDIAGAAYIFTRSGTSWSEQQKIYPSGAPWREYFGWSVSISDDGNTAIIGAFRENTGGTQAGAAYIFTRTNSEWTQRFKLKASDAERDDLFGAAVAISGDGNTVIVGAAGEDSNIDTYRSGAVYIFRWSGTDWTEQQKIQASDKDVRDVFGAAVAISEDGNTAIVGAWSEDTGGDDAGAAYIFTRSGTTWTQQQKIQSADKQAGDYFGGSVSISGEGNTAIVGASNEGNIGAAYIFTRSGTTWTQQQKLQASDASWDDRFGSSVTISEDGNTAIVGAPYEDTVDMQAGAAYIFTRSGTSWSEKQKIQASDASWDDSFGNYLAISNDGKTSIVGAYSDNTSDANKSGSAYIYQYNF